MGKENKGICFIAGAGPGDADLITVRLQRIIKKADVIVYDDLIDKGLLKLRKADAELIYVGKRSGRHSETQEYINALLVQKTKEGKVVLRLKGGDPFVFGRGSEECQALSDSGLRYHLIPGVTSAVAVPEMAGIPVTERCVSRDFTVITGHRNTGDKQSELEEYISYGKYKGTLVFLMGLSRLKFITESLLQGGMDASTPAAVISAGTTVSQYVIRGTVENIADMAEADDRCITPATVVIGETASRDYIYEACPIIVATGTDEFVHKVRDEFDLHGLSVIPCPHLSITACNEERLRNITADLSGFSHIAFMSRHAVRIFMESLLQQNDIRSLTGIKIACVGKATAGYLKENYGLRADLVPGVFDSESMIKLISDSISVDRIADPSVLLVRAMEGDREGNKILDRESIPYEDISVYSLTPEEKAVRGLSDSMIIPDYLLFGSAKGVREYAKLKGPVGLNTYIICIGRYTIDAAREEYPELKADNIIQTDRSVVEDFVETIFRLEDI